MSITELTADPEVQASWRELVEQGDMDAALGSYMRFGPEEDGVQRTLEDIIAILGLVRAKSFNRAGRILDQIEERGSWFDWEGFRQDFQALRASSAALDSRETDNARAELDKVRLKVFAAEVANMRGTALIFEGELEGARVEFENALEIDPRHYRAVTNLGNAALEAGELDLAIEHYEKAIRLNGDFPNAHHNLGVAWRKKGKIGKSINSLKSGQRAQQRFDQAEAREQLGRMSKGLGKGNSGKYLKWLLYGGVAVAVYWFLSSRGTI